MLSGGPPRQRSKDSGFVLSRGCFAASTKALSCIGFPEKYMTSPMWRP